MVYLGNIDGLINPFVDAIGEFSINSTYMIIYNYYIKCLEFNCVMLVQGLFV